MNSSLSLENCNCEHCRRQLPFTLPQRLLDAVKAQQLVIFAGAGISTEKAGLFPTSLCEDVSEELGLPTRPTIPFPEVMTQFCAQPDGRARLLEKLRFRLEYVRGFPQLYNEATSFHRALAPLWQITQIITTNWDDYFERECGALPFVAPQDFVFWSVRGRKVLKLHGSFSSLSSIVATTEDYETCSRKLSDGLIGSSLRLMLATSTILFVGYSLTDSDFLQIRDALMKELGPLHPQAYVVTLDAGAVPRLQELGLIPIVTDATHFITGLYTHLTKSGEVLPTEQVYSLGALLHEIVDKHVKLLHEVNTARHPEIVHCASYQDGLIHALERILALAKDGHYFCPDHAAAVIAPYRSLRTDALRRGKYHDVAYIDGYVNGHILLLASPAARKGAPKYYVFGSRQDIRTAAEYHRIAMKAQRLHKAAFNQAVSMVKRELRGGEGVVPQHTPFLVLPVVAPEV